MSDIKERESTKTRSCGEGLSDRVGSRLQEFSGFKAAAHQTPISKSYDWLDNFLNRVNDQVDNYNSHFKSHDVSAGRRFRLLDSIKKKANTVPQIGGFSGDYFENIRTPWGTLGDLIFLDWVDDEEEDVAVQQESNSRIVNGWGSNAEANPFVPASVSASPWLNTKYRPARVASKKTNRLQTRSRTQENINRKNKKQYRGKPTFTERSILRGLMADQYDQTISFTDLPLSIQRNIQQELKDEILESTEPGKYSSPKQRKTEVGQNTPAIKKSAKNSVKRQNRGSTKKYTSSPLRRQQRSRKSNPFASSRYAKHERVNSTHAANRMKEFPETMSVQATKNRVDSATGLSPVLQKSPIVRYASKTDGQSQIESSLPANTTQSKRSKNYSGISRINSSKQSNVHSSVRGLSRQQQEVQNIRKLLSDVNNYNKENKEDYIPSTFYSLMRGIDPDLSKGDLVDIIDGLSTDGKRSYSARADNKKVDNKQVDNKKADKRSTSSNKRSRNNRKYSKTRSSSPINMSSVDYASTRQGMWSKGNERSILPTQAFLGAFDQASDKSISGAEAFLSGLLSSEQKQNSDIGSSRGMENIQNATDRINAGVGQKLSVKSRGSNNKKAPMNSLFYSAPEMNSVVDHIATASSESFEEDGFQSNPSTLGENTTRSVNGWGEQNESRASAWLSKDTPGARVIRSSKSSPIIEASSRQVVNVIEKILTKSLPITTTHSARNVLDNSLQRSSLRREMTKSIEAQVSQEFKKSLSASNSNLKGITSEVLASVLESAQVKNILEKNANYLVEDSSNENQKNKRQVSLLQSATKKNRDVIERGIVRELEANMSQISTSIQNQLQSEIKKEMQANNGRPLEESQVQRIINRVNQNVEKNYSKSITKKVVESQKDVIGSILGKDLGKEFAQQSADLGDFAEEVIASMGIENITQRSLLSATQKALTTQLTPSRNNKTRFSLPSSKNLIGQRGIQELKSYLNDNDLKLNSVQKNLEKRLSDITGLSLNELGSKRLESTMTVSQLKEVRSSLDSYAQELFDRGGQFEALSKRLDGSIMSSKRENSPKSNTNANTRQNQLLRKNGLLLDDAFNVIVSEAMSDEHADDILNGIATAAESSRASAWFTNDVSSAEVVKQQNAEMRKLTSMLTDLKSINKSKNASSRTLNYISDREERAESMKQKRDSAFHENGYNQKPSRKTRSIRHDSGVFVDAKYLEQSPDSFGSMMDGTADNPSRQTDRQSRFGKLPFAMTLEAMQYRSNDSSLPSWAKRSSEKPQIRGTSDIVQSLVRASSADEVVDVLFDRGDSLTTSLPKGASKVIEGIRKEAHKLERQLSEPTLVAQSRISDDGEPQRRKTRASTKVIQGFQGLTPFQEGQAEEQKASDTKLQKLTKQLEDLILIAEHQGRDAARQGVRMSVDAPEEEGSRGDTPGELNRDEQVDLEALINHVYFEITERLRQEEDLFNFDNDSFKRGGY